MQRGQAQAQHTSMSKSLSTLTASPNRLRYCARFANCHMFRSVCSVLGSSAASSVSISSRARLRAGIVKGGFAGERVQKVRRAVCIIKWPYRRGYSDQEEMLGIRAR